MQMSINPKTNGRAGKKEWTALAVLMLPLLLVSMDVSVLYFAVPFISQDLEPTATQQLWILDIYGFVLAGLLLTMGSLGDRIGRRRLLLIGAFGFGPAFDRAYVMGGGFVVAACGFLVITRVTPHSSVAVALVGATVLSVGLVTVMTLVTEIAMGAIDPARAGSASAVLETSSEFGGALGIAVLGSIGAAIYGSAMDSSMPAELPGVAAAVARETLAGATVVAAELPGVTGTEVLAAAREAFTSGMHGVGVVGAVLMIAAGAVCVLFLRRATVVDAAAVDEVVASTTG